MVQVFEFREMLIEIVIVYPPGEAPVTLECFDLKSEMLFTIYRDKSGTLIFHAESERVPLELIPLVAKIANEEL